MGCSLHNMSLTGPEEWTLTETTDWGIARQYSAHSQTKALTQYPAPNKHTKGTRENEQVKKLKKGVGGRSWVQWQPVGLAFETQAAWFWVRGQSVLYSTASLGWLRHHVQDCEIYPSTTKCGGMHRQGLMGIWGHTALRGEPSVHRTL